MRFLLAFPNSPLSSQSLRRTLSSSSSILFSSSSSSNPSSFSSSPLSSEACVPSSPSSSPSFSSSRSFLPLQQIIYDKSQPSLVSYQEKDGKLIKISPSSSSHQLNIKQSLQNMFNFLLPKGYPSSIEPGYAQYAGLQSLGYIFSTAGGVMSTQSLLLALGLSDGVIPMAATLNWIIKDGLGQFGGIFFASFVNNQFDQHPKRWRMISSIVMDISGFIELLTPLFPKYFIFFASFANIGKNISFLSASASRVAIHKSFTFHENLADLTAKTGSQTILSSLIGSCLGISLSSLISLYPESLSYPLTASAFLACSSIHLFCMYSSLQFVTIKTLNVFILQHIFSRFLQNDPLQQKFHVISPSEYKKSDPVLSIRSDSWIPTSHPPIFFGSDLTEIFSTVAEFQVRFTSHFLGDDDFREQATSSLLYLISWLSIAPTLLQVEFISLFMNTLMMPRP
jgi:hypothetical protein